MTRVTLYGKAGCHLCDEARAVVDAVRAERAFELEEVDVARWTRCSTPATASASRWWRSTARTCFDYVVDAAALRERLDKVAA